MGSGDAFLAGMVVARADGEPWVAAAAAGLGAGAANAEVAGAGRLDPARARELAAIADVAELAGEARAASSAWHAGASGCAQRGVIRVGWLDQSRGDRR